ncbi:hypothetical protein SELMODRAFT_59797, partial [Selaginella moellendorffii]
TWGNHFKVFMNAGLAVRTYRYYDNKTRGLDYDEYARRYWCRAKRLICAHNPTTPQKWEGIRQAIRNRGHLLFYDNRTVSFIQGFASGSLDKDALAVRTFVA